MSSRPPQTERPNCAPLVPTFVQPFDAHLPHAARSQWQPELESLRSLKRPSHSDSRQANHPFSFFPGRHSEISPMVGQSLVAHTPAPSMWDVDVNVDVGVDRLCVAIMTQAAMPTSPAACLAKREHPYRANYLIPYPFVSRRME